MLYDTEELRALGGTFGHLEGYRKGCKLNKQCIFTLVSSKRSNWPTFTLTLLRLLLSMMNYGIVQVKITLILPLAHFLVLFVGQFESTNLKQFSAIKLPPFSAISLLSSVFFTGTRKESGRYLMVTIRPQPLSSQRSESTKVCGKPVGKAEITFCGLQNSLVVTAKDQREQWREPIMRSMEAITREHALFRLELAGCCHELHVLVVMCIEI